MIIHSPKLLLCFYHKTKKLKLNKKHCRTEAEKLFLWALSSTDQEDTNSLNVRKDHFKYDLKKKESTTLVNNIYLSKVYCVPSVQRMHEEKIKIKNKTPCCGSNPKPLLLLLADLIQK